MEPTKDRELSRLLREWQVEDAPPALETRVLSIRGPRRRRRAAHRMLAFVGGYRKSLWMAAAAGIAFLIVVTQAIPQTLKLVSPMPPAPYTVDSEYIRYADDGTQTVEMSSTSYTSESGSEIILQRTIPEHPLGTAFGRTFDAILPYWSRFTSAVMVSSNELEQVHQAAARTVGVITCGETPCLAPDRWGFARAESGPSAPCAAGSVAGSETILGHSTIGVIRPLPNVHSTSSSPAAERITMWMAPDLGCFALRVFVEEQQPDGAYRVVREKQALRVQMKP